MRRSLVSTGAAVFSTCRPGRLPKPWARTEFEYNGLSRPNETNDLLEEILDIVVHLDDSIGGSNYRHLGNVLVAALALLLLELNGNTTDRASLITGDIRRQRHTHFRSKPECASSGA